MLCKRCGKDVRLGIGGVCICGDCKTLIIQEWAVRLGELEVETVVTTSGGSNVNVMRDLAYYSPGCRWAA